MSGTREFKIKRYENKNKDFLDAYKRVTVSQCEDRELTKDKLLLSRYKNDVVATFNDLLSYICGFYDPATPENKETFVETIKDRISKVKRVFSILKLTYEWTDNIFQAISIQNLNVSK